MTRLRFCLRNCSARLGAGPKADAKGISHVARFDRYLLQQLMLVFGFFSFVLVMIYWINSAVRLFDRLIADGQSAAVFLEFTALSLPSVIVLALPLAAFTASVYSTNRLSQDSELVVKYAAL